MQYDGSNTEISRLSHLAEIGSALGSTLDAEEALRRLQRLVVPRLADWCVVVLVEDGTVVKTIVVQDDHRAVVDVGWGPTPVSPSGYGSETGLGSVLQGGPATIVDGAVASSWAKNELDRHLLHLFERLGAASAMIVGLRARHLTFGALVAVRVSPEHPYGRADLIMADDIGNRAGVALDNARLYREQRGIAEALQRSLLSGLPDVSPAAVGAVYLPAQVSAEVGGDWYDSFLLPDGAIALVLGDVAGHDLTAAVRMSDLRGFLRAASLQSAEPAFVMEQLDEAMAQFTPDTTATAIFARLELAANGAHRLRWSNAGHPPPLLVLPDETSRYLDAAPDLLLGARWAVARQTNDEPMPPDSTILLYSDGLVEDRQSGLEPGLQRLRRVAARLANVHPAAMCQEIVDELAGSGEDDIAIIAMRVPPGTGVPGRG